VITGESAPCKLLSPAVARLHLNSTAPWGFRPRLYAYACVRRLRDFLCKVLLNNSADRTLSCGALLGTHNCDAGYRALLNVGVRVDAVERSAKRGWRLGKPPFDCDADALLWFQD